MTLTTILAPLAEAPSVGEKIELTVIELTQPSSNISDPTSSLVIDQEMIVSSVDNTLYYYNVDLSPATEYIIYIKKDISGTKSLILPPFLMKTEAPEGTVNPNVSQVIIKGYTPGALLAQRFT